jgi:O-phosphoseryl-tRNA(Cys) synthetase
MTHFDWDRVQREERARRQGSEPAWDGSPNESAQQMGLASLEPLVQKYLQAGVRGQNLVVAVANSTEFSVETVAQWIQRNHPELKRKSKEALSAARRKKKR